MRMEEGRRTNCHEVKLGGSTKTGGVRSVGCGSLCGRRPSECVESERHASELGDLNEAPK